MWSALYHFVIAVWSTKKAESAGVKYVEIIAVIPNDFAEAVKGWVITHSVWEIVVTVCAFVVTAVWGKVRNMGGPAWLLLALCAALIALGILKLFGIIGGIVVGILLVVSVGMIIWEKTRHAHDQKALKLDQILSLVDWSFEHQQTTPQWQSLTFKRKIRAVLRNDTGKEIEVDTPDWAADAGDLGIQPSANGPGAASRICLENKQAGGWKQGKWLEETKHLIVPPAHHFEAWVGLSHEYTDATLQRHVREGRIGTLVFCVSIQGQKREIRIRLKSMIV